MSGDHPLRCAAVIVASKPLGHDGGDLLPAMIRAGQVTFIERVIIRFQLVGAAPIIVITGFENERLERHLARMSVVCLHNPDWEEATVFDDAMLGLRYAERTCPACDKVLLATPLIPSVQEKTLMTLLESEKSVAVPVCQGEEGLPLAVHREVIAQIPRDAEGESLTDLAALLPASVERVSLCDQGVLARSENLTARQPMRNRGHDLPLRARLKLSLARESVFFGPGPATLLRLIDETGSVRTACVRMKLSYSKGWQILNLLEAELGAAVVDRKPGGQEGGSSKLTATGRELLHRFEQFSAEVQSSANLLFEQIFRDFLPEEE